MKSQKIRVLDVLVLGPFMLWAASRRTLPPWARVALTALGLGTIVYNGTNYQRIQKGVA